MGIAVKFSPNLALRDIAEFKVGRRKDLILKIEKEAKKYYSGNNDGCHDWSHVERVRNLALHIGKIEKANLEILEIASLLHDIGRSHEVRSRGKVCHACAGAKMAKDILASLGLPNEIIDKVYHCIEVHRYSHGHLPKTLEAKIIFDSDKLDSIGAVGIGRVFMFAGVTSGKLCTGNEKTLARSAKNLSFTKDDTAPLEYELKLKYVKNKMLTKEGKRLAKERHDFMKKFFERFWREVGGNI